MAQITIKINGENYPCRLTMGALLAYKRKTGQDVGNLNADDIESILLLLGCCLESTCRAEGKQLPEGFNADVLADFINMEDAAELWAKGVAEGNTESQARVSQI